jgi:hypothetical protein
MCLMKSRHAFRNSLTDLNSLISRPGGEITTQENIQLSNDPSFGVSRPIRLVALGCSTLYLLAPTVAPSGSAVIRLVISVCLRLPFDLDRFAWPLATYSFCRFCFCPENEEESGLLLIPDPLNRSLVLGMGFLCDTFPRQLLTVLAVMLSRPESGRFVVRDKHIDVQTEQVRSNRTGEGRAAFEGSERRQPACVGEDCNAEPRNELEMGIEA